MKSKRRVLGVAASAATMIVAAMLVPAVAMAQGDLAVTKSDSVDPATVGTPFDYTIGVSNAGPMEADAVELADDLPNELDFVSATTTQGSCDNQGRKVTCELGELANGSTATVTIRVEPRRDGTITNTASLTSADDPVSANNQDSETTQLVGQPGGGGGGGEPRCDGRKVTIEGTTGDDVLTGTGGRDVILARGGNDRIDSLGGNDVICAQGGNDKVRARGGHDVVRGGGGKDRIRGGGAGDTLRGGTGRDRLNGGGGADTLDGGGGNDRCIGGPGRDTKRRC
ncbi:MAG: hypothetical protein ACRDKX_03175 [Solirubrobacterales bacterium]